MNLPQSPGIRSPTVWFRNQRWTFSYYKWRNWYGIRRKWTNAKKIQCIGHRSADVEKVPFIRNERYRRRIFFRDKLFVPDAGQLKFRFIKKIHDDPAARHPGKTKTYEISSRYYYWPGIINDVKRFVKNCYGCRKSKNSRDEYHGALKPLPVPDRRWSHISIDFIVDLPVNRDLWGKDCINIMVVVNRLSKMVKCIFMDGITAKDAAKAFYIHIWKNHGLPSFIISDRGRTFVSYFWDQLTTRLGIKADLSTAYHPETDGQTEILNSIFEQYLKAYVNFPQNDWASWLPSAEFVINNHVSEITQCTLFSINSGQHFKMGLKSDLFVSKPMDFQKKMFSLTNSSKRWPRSTWFSKSKWFSFKHRTKISQINISKTFPITP